MTMLLDGSISLPYNKVKCLYNNFTTLSQQKIHGRLLWVVIRGQKNNFNDRFKLEPITTYHLKFVVKTL